LECDPDETANITFFARLIPKGELGNYEGKVQDTVEVLDVFKWRKSREK
jgi:hypothetical protein